MYKHWAWKKNAKTVISVIDQCHKSQKALHLIENISTILKPILDTYVIQTLRCEHLRQVCHKSQIRYSQLTGKKKLSYK